MRLAWQLLLNSVFRDMIPFSLVDRYQHSEGLVANILYNYLVPLRQALPVSIEYSIPISESLLDILVQNHTVKKISNKDIPVLSTVLYRGHGHLMVLKILAFSAWC